MGYLFQCLWFCCHIILSLFSGSCTVDDSQQQSAVKWLEFQHTTGIMPHVKTGIAICMQGNHPQQNYQTVARVTNEWLAALSEQRPGVVTTSSFGCPGQMTVHFSTQVSRAHALPKQHPEINLGPGEESSYIVVLHEMGHAFGLNDTYVEGIWSCQPGQPQSLMCSLGVGSITADDRAGIAAVYDRAFGAGSTEGGSQASFSGSPSPSPGSAASVTPELNPCFCGPDNQGNCMLHRSGQRLATTELWQGGLCNMATCQQMFRDVIASNCF